MPRRRCAPPRNDTVSDGRFSFYCNRSTARRFVNVSLRGGPFHGPMWQSGSPSNPATFLAAPPCSGGLQPKPLGTSSLRAGCGGVKLRGLRAGRQKEPFLGSSPRNCFGKGAGERIYSQRWGPARVGIAQMLLQGRRCAARRGMKTFIVKARRPHPSRLCRATGACRPGLVENSPPDCFPGTAAPIGEGFGGSPAPLPQKLVPMGNISLEIPLERMYYI